MNKKSTVFMELGGPLGMALGLVIAVILFFLKIINLNIGLIIVVVLMLLGRIIGYFLDQIVNRNE